MNIDEAYDVISKLASEWPYVKNWDEDKTARWVQDIQELDYQRAQNAVRACIDTCQHAPAWAEFKEQYRTITWQALAPERQPVKPRAELGAGYLPKEENIRRLRELRKILAKDDTAGLEHNHHRGAEKCPVCSKHDHDAEGRHDSQNCRRCKTTGKAWYVHLTTPEEP